jgi:hypothetical protein
MTNFAPQQIQIGQPTYEKVNEELFLDKSLHVILNKSKLAYRIYVMLIANKGLKNRLKTWQSYAFTYFAFISEFCDMEGKHVWVI